MCVCVCVCVCLGCLCKTGQDGGGRAVLYVGGLWEFISCRYKVCGLCNVYLVYACY